MIQPGGLGFRVRTTIPTFQFKTCRLASSQDHAPVTGFDVITSRDRSTPFVFVIGGLKVSISGIPTP